MSKLVLSKKKSIFPSNETIVCDETVSEKNISESNSTRSDEENSMKDICFSSEETKFLEDYYANK
jgi:hypothetical protein